MAIAGPVVFPTTVTFKSQSYSFTLVGMLVGTLVGRLVGILVGGEVGLLVGSCCRKEIVITRYAN